MIRKLVFTIRKTYEEIKEICNKYNVSRANSWSRYSTYSNSKYEYLLKYILHKKEDRSDCIYAVTGGMAHEIMEDLYLNKISYEDMDGRFEDAWLTAGIAELKFDRNSEEKNKKISDKYYKNLKHFFNNHEMIPYKVEIERFITIMLDKYLFQGYIDMCFKDNDGCFNILDFKTSTIYKGGKALKECGQLVLYAIGLHQMGVPFDKIKICWDFLKYVKVDCTQANGKITTREIERYEIGNKLQTNAKMWLKKCGYEDQLLEYLDELAKTNDITCLPKEVQDKYTIHDCIVYVNLTEDLINDWTKKIVSTMDEIYEKEEQYKVESMIDKDEAEKIFFDTPEEVEKQSYYFATLCGYSANLHKPYKKYLEKLESKKNGEQDLFSNVGSDTEEDSNQITRDDLDWLSKL